jgi:hypothetical protein
MALLFEQFAQTLIVVDDDASLQGQLAEQRARPSRTTQRSPLVQSESSWQPSLGYTQAMLTSRSGAPPMRLSQQPRAKNAQAPPGSALQSASREHAAGTQTRPGAKPAAVQNPPAQSASLSHASTTHTFN